jgi:hypothetical protein
MVPSAYPDPAEMVFKNAQQGCVLSASAANRKRRRPTGTRSIGSGWCAQANRLEDLQLARSFQPGACIEFSNQYL